MLDTEVGCMRSFAYARRITIQKLSPYHLSWLETKKPAQDEKIKYSHEAKKLRNL